MMKSLMYRLFGVGKIPASLTAQLKNERLVLLDEGIKGSVTYLNFRSPQRIASWKKQWHTAAIALTEVRLVGLRFSQTIINVPLTDERLRRMQFSVEASDALLVSFDAALFQPDWSGTIEYRFRTPQAQAFIDRLRRFVVGG